MMRGGAVMRCRRYLIAKSTRKPEYRNGRIYF